MSTPAIAFALLVACAIVGGVSVRAEPPSDEERELLIASLFEEARLLERAGGQHDELEQVYLELEEALPVERMGRRASVAHNLSMLHMLTGETEQALEWSRRAVERSMSSSGRTRGTGEYGVWYALRLA